jgi:hypothetical protein
LEKQTQLTDGKQYYGGMKNVKMQLKNKKNV